MHYSKTYKADGNDNDPQSDSYKTLPICQIAG